MAITGIGGIFFKVADPAATRAWYEKHLGIKMEAWGAQLPLKNNIGHDADAYQVLSPTQADTTYFAPSEQLFMINLRVVGWEQLLEKLESEGIEILGKEVGDFGKFAWILDLNGIKLELWEQ